MGYLCLILIVLKLFELIAISWWLVFAPIWVPWLIVLGVSFIVGLVQGISGLLRDLH